MSESYGLDRVPDSTGFMILNEDGKVLKASGELVGQERIAGLLLPMVSNLVRLQKPDGSRLAFERVSIVYEGFLYALTLHDQKILVVKRTHNIKTFDPNQPRLDSL